VSRAALRVAVLISGRGSNLQALIQSCREPNSPAHIALVISSNPDAAGLGIAREHGIDALAIDHRQYKSREKFDAALDASLRGRGIEFVCMAGFMRLLTRGFVDSWHDRLINIHPSLLPAFKGRHPQRQALQAGAKVSGCTVHFVTPEMDDGPIIAQEGVPVLPGDDEASLSARILDAEHRLYPRALRMVAERRLTAEDRAMQDRARQ
jgi:phosphoribosylglycinamide formyltransferase-1